MAEDDLLAGSMPHLVDVRELDDDENNARTHDQGQLDQLKAAFRRFGFVGVIGYNVAGLKIGHGRKMAALQMWESGEEVMGPGKRAVLPKWHLPAVDVSGLSDDETRALVIADNKLALNAGWDEAKLASEIAALSELNFDLPVIGFDPKELNRLLGGGDGKIGAGSMAAEFLVPPFTVLNAREGWWQDRKREWLALGIKSEVGREGQGRAFGQDMLDNEGTNVVVAKGPRRSTGVTGGPGEIRERPAGLGGVTLKSLSSHPRYYEQKIAAERRLGRELTNDEFEREHWVAPDSEIISGSSIFDPVLCEMVYRWFSPKGGQVLDPFAGGSVRGIVAAALGRRYCGIDLRPEQVAANQAQWPAVAAQLAGQGGDDAEQPAERPEPDWLIGDAAAVLPGLEIKADLLFSCPPYGDLEVYSDDPRDISTMDVEAFDLAYQQIVIRAVDRLADDRFAVWVVGDYRDKRGLYRNFVGKTTAAFQAAGMGLYNEMILITTIGSLAIRAARGFRKTRKLGKSHQTVLVFVKGDPRRATEALGPVDVTPALDMIEPQDEGDDDEA